MSEPGGAARRIALALLAALAAGTGPGRAQDAPRPYLDEQGLNRLLFGTSVDSKTLGVFAETAAAPVLPKRWARVAHQPRLDGAGHFVLELRLSLPDGLAVGLPGDPAIPLRIELGQSLGLVWSAMELDGVGPLEGIPGPARYGVGGRFRVRVQGQVTGPLPPRLAARVQPVGLWQGHVISLPRVEVSTLLGRGRVDPPKPRPGSGRVELTVDPAPGTLVLPEAKRAFVGRTWRTDLPPGEHRVLGLRNGNPAVERRVAVTAGGYRDEWVRLPAAGN